MDIGMDVSIPIPASASSGAILPSAPPLPSTPDALNDPGMARTGGPAKDSYA